MHVSLLPYFPEMGKALKGTRLRNIKIKVLRRNINGCVKVHYLTHKDIPKPSSQQTGLLDPTLVPSEQDEAAGCSSSSETSIQ